MTFIAVGLGVMQFFYVPPVRPIAFTQTNQIKIGMSQRQIIRLLGSPYGKAIGATATYWSYDYTTKCAAIDDDISEVAKLRR